MDPANYLHMNKLSELNKALTALQIFMVSGSVRKAVTWIPIHEFKIICFRMYHLIAIASAELLTQHLVKVDK